MRERITERSVNGRLERFHGRRHLARRAAEDWGNDQEAQARRSSSQWRDPRDAEITLAEWIEARWWPGQDLGPRTEDRYRYHIRSQILPAFGDRALNTFTDPQEIATWEKNLRAHGGYAERTASDARALLSTILGDARDAGLIPANVAARIRGRGRKSKRNNRRRDRAAEKKWASPLQVVLIAERCALLTGQDDDFTAIITAGWTGVRWGELIGVERPDIQPTAIHLDWQLSELNGRFEKIAPKDESYRLIDLPPFLYGLLARQIKARPDGRCRCPGSACDGTGGYLFLGTDRGHHRRSGFNRRFWHPAIDGRYPATNGKHPRPARPVLVDMAPGWPGTPLRPAWPPAVSGQDWAPPRGRGRTSHEHRQVASWLPIKPGLVPHGLRHGHKTWMIEGGIPEVLQHDRLGHEMDGIKATYSHVSVLMRENLKQALQARWETALDQRMRLCEHPPSPYWKSS